MLEEDILDFLTEKKTLDEIRSELNVNKKKLKRKLKSMLQDEIIESDGDYYWKTEKSVRIHTSYIPIVLLITIVLIGFYLRIYHIDYPVVGYHNWKEEHYLGEARNFAREGFFKYGFFVPAWDYPFLDADPSGAHSDTFPTISVIVALFFMLLGPELWIARLVGILFNTGTIVMMYLLVKKLFKREDLALVSALLTATLPLFVFFSHNVQLINPGIFFMLASGYFYLRWRDSFKGNELILTILFLTLSALTKYPFLIIAIPMFLTLPFKRPIGLKMKLRGEWKAILISILILSSLPLWFFYSNFIISEKYGTKAYTVTEGMIKLDVLSKPEWWKTQESYARDNYTLTGVFFAVLGLIILIFLSFKEKRFGEKFILFYLLGAIPFLTVMSYKIGGHSYHQYPIAPLVIILIAYFIIKIGEISGRFISKGRPLSIIIIIFLLSFFAFPINGFIFEDLKINPSACNNGFCEVFSDSISRQFDTQFIGLDVAGEYIKENSNENERIMFPSHQSYGVLWHADRKGYTPDELDRIKIAEEKNATWMFIYQWGFKIMQDEGTWNYVKEHYSLKQIAFLKTDKGNQPIYFLLKRDGEFDERDLDLAGKEIKHRDYEYTRGIQRMYYVNLEG